MSHDVEYASSFTVVGIAVRTSNKTAHEIGELWSRFYQSNAAGQIAPRLDDSLYSVYTDYESDHTGSFTVLIGCAVPELTPVPEGMEKRVVSAGRYAVFPATGKVPESVVQAWSTVWNTPLDRLYGTDFERYQADGTVAVHVGVR